MHRHRWELPRACGWGCSPVHNRVVLAAEAPRQWAVANIRITHVARKSRNSRVRPSTLPPVHLVRIPRDKNMITPGRCFTVLDSSLPPAIVNLFISCTDPSSYLDPHLSQGEVQAIPPGVACILLESFNATPYETGFHVTCS